MAEFQFICERIKWLVERATAAGAEPSVVAVATELAREGLPSGDDVNAVIREHIGRGAVAAHRAPSSRRAARITPRVSHRGPAKKTKNKKRARKK